MSQKKNRKAGGLILKRKELESLLAEPNTEGLAFAINIPGKASNVSLSVLRVFANGEMLLGEKRTCRTRRAASGGLQYPYGKVDNYEFKYLEKLKECGFSFAFYSKKEFSLLFKDEWDEVFIGGGKITYTDTSHLERELDEWFTLTLSLRKKISQIVINKDTTNAFISKRWPQKAPIVINDFASKKFIPFKDLDESSFIDNLGAHKVRSIIIDGKNQDIKGLVLKVGRRLKLLIFPSSSSVKSIILQPDNSLKLIITNEVNATDPIPIEPSENLIRLGGFPSTAHMISCPPHWNNTGFTSSFKNTLEEAVMEGLNIK